jgi:hypothetical protein
MPTRRVLPHGQPGRDVREIERLSAAKSHKSSTGFIRNSPPRREFIDSAAESTLRRERRQTGTLTSF